MIREIDALETFLVRHPVLRPGKPAESCHFNGDTLESTKHFGFFISEELAGVISVFEANHPKFGTEKQFQIRGMAVLEKFRKQSIGEKLVREIEKYVLKQYGELIWFNAREIAVGFYRKVGYEISGTAFNIGDIGAHFVMFKNLKPSRNEN